jgi:hypothetical protein
MKLAWTRIRRNHYEARGGGPAPGRLYVVKAHHRSFHDPLWVTCDSADLTTDLYTLTQAKARCQEYEDSQPP